MRLSKIAALPSFALLAPAFGDGHAWTLVAPLREGEGACRVLFARYEEAGRAARSFTGEVQRMEAIEFDLPSATLNPELDETGHREGVHAIREAIAAGDVYQVNLTLRARFACRSGGALLGALCRKAVPRFAAWVRMPDGTEFVSASPELFIEWDDRRVRCEPMKGTARTAAALERSTKDEAELAMITDLMRNDLTPLCVPRSVRVACERRFLQLPYAVQAVSDVEGTLREGISAHDVLDALHPGGSITGAPKEAARELISQLETTPRGAYCGTLGLVEGDRGRFSLLIRTAQRDGDAWVYGVGGGIVWDSDAEAELAEARLKLGALR